MRSLISAALLGRRAKLKPPQVARLTVLKDKNMEKAACEGYAELVRLGDCDFVEAPG